MSAEQAAAETYRQMFREGNFYVEFQIEVTKNIRNEPFEGYGLTSSIPKTFNRVSKKFNPAKQNFLQKLGSNPFSFSSKTKTEFQILAGKNGARVYRENLKAKNPEVLYKDGEYYNFFRDPVEGKPNKFTRRMLILSEEKLNSQVLEPQEGWQDIRTELALPDELAIFYWNEPYREQDSGWGEPVYNGSSTREINKKTYDCDQYISDIKSLAGTIIAQEVYNALYENGKLVMVQKYFLRDGKEKLIETVNVKNITSQVPDTAFAIDKVTKVYKPRNGDMNDLLNIYEEVGKIGGKQK